MIRFFSLKHRDGIPVPYAQAQAFQLELLEQRARDEIEDTVLFLEHPPVITRGRGLQRTGETRVRHMPMPVSLPSGIEFSDSERGGDLTYHGPGQLVVYPIMKLGGSDFAPLQDVESYIRNLEQVVINDLATFGKVAGRRPAATGVWVGEKKVASAGIAIRKWVAWHGLAVNILNDLTPFHLISPCGFSGEVMTSYSALGIEVQPSRWRAECELRFAQQILQINHSPALETVSIQSLTL